jgi:hypothetical protein
VQNQPRLSSSPVLPSGGRDLGWHEDAATLITRLARQLASHTGKEVDEQIKHLFQRMGILLMRGNSALINRTPDYADAEVDGDLDFDI